METDGALGAVLPNTPSRQQYINSNMPGMSDSGQNQNCYGEVSCW